ncbi:MAG: transporter [Burkholderiaceae bacterium]
MRRFTPFHVAAALLPAFAPTSRAASAPPLEVFESVDVVDAGRWRSDIALPTARRPGDRDADRPLSMPTVLRVGIGKSIELREQGDRPPEPAAFGSAADSMRRLHGFTDVSFGAKWRVRGGDAGWLPGVAWLANVETGNGAPAFRGRDFRPSLRATAEWTLPRDMTLGLMPGVFRDRDDRGKRYAAAVMALTLGKAWTPRVHTFVELAGERVVQAQRGAAFVNVDTGVAFLAAGSLQLAAVVSCGVMNAPRQASGGLSVSTHF